MTRRSLLKAALAGCAAMLVAPSTLLAHRPKPHRPQKAVQRELTKRYTLKFFADETTGVALGYTSGLARVDFV